MSESTPLRIVIEALPVATVTIAVAIWFAGQPDSGRTRVGGTVSLTSISPDSAESLARDFARRAYDWPPGETSVPEIAVRALPHDLGDEPVARKKTLFFRALLPLVLAENAEIRADRARLQRLATTDAASLNDEQTRFLRRLAERYEVEGEPRSPAVRRRLLRRVDTIPPALALAQAAIETGWGTSRFAREGNNLFGEWTWNAAEGLTPRDRVEGRDHFVRRFPSLRASVESYLNNLNTHPAYERLRALRAQTRRRGGTLRAVDLAQGLESYSERGAAYTADVRALIRSNDLGQVTRQARLAVP